LKWQDPWHERKRIFEGSFDARASNAYQLLSRGESREALEILESLIEQQPNNKVVLHDLSIAYSRVGDEDKAFRALREGLVKHPDEYAFHYSIADHYAGRGNLDKALVHADRAVDLKPTLAAPHTRRGLLLIEQRKIEEALSAFESALRYEADDPQIFLYAGQMAATLKRWPQAIQRFEDSVRVDPSFTLGHVNLAGGFAYTNRFEEARAALERAQRLGTHRQQVENAFRQLADQEAESK
jgi:superkiller protein 3